MALVQDSTSPPLASRAPRWLLVLYLVGAVIATVWAVLWTIGVIAGQYSGSHIGENLTINFVTWFGAIAFACVQSLSLFALYMRRHWGRTMATIGAALWVLSGIGVVITALALWGLHRQWDPGVDSTFTRDHPSAPRYVVGLTAVGTLLLIPWLWFLFIYLPNLINQIAPGAPDLRGVFAVALYLSLPLWIVQALAAIGLVRKHDWGAVLAVVTCVVWTLSLVGLPFGIAGLVVLWRWQHPALKPLAAAGAPA